MSVRRERRGVYQVRWREGGRGSPAHSVMVYGATDAEAKRRADTIDTEIRNRKAAGERVISIAPDRPDPLTLSEFLTVWHQAHGKELAGSTQASYAVVWDKWIGPRLGGMLVNEITPAEVARFRARSSATERGRRRCCACWRCWGRCSQRRCARARSRRARRGRSAGRASAERRAVRPPTPERVEIIRAGLASDVEKALMTLLAYVGLRPQEALAAVWSDITGGKLVVDASKTGRTRVVPLLPIVRQELAELQMRRAGRGRRRRSSRRTPAGLERQSVSVFPAASVVEGRPGAAAV